MRAQQVVLLWLVIIAALACSTSSNAAASTAHRSVGFRQQQQQQQQTPWDPVGEFLPHQWGSRHQPGANRNLLQNPDREVASFSGRQGLMEDYVPAGYHLETHKALTPDGWVLTIHRFPRGMQRHTEPGPRPVVLLIHGFSLSSLSFALFNPNESIAYILADAGFDVWMMNTRTNDFSRGNLHYSHRQAEYFQVSMDELGLIDVPTCLHYVLEKSGAKKLNILTHSQGGTLAYIALSSFPDLQAKVNSLVAMGPPCFLEYMKAAVIQNQAQARSDHLFYVVGMGGFLTSRRLWPWIRQFNRSWWADGFASALWLTFYGPSWRIPPDDQVVISNTWPATVTSRDITHWAQMVKDARLRLQRFDHGTDCTNRTRYSETCNQQAYGTLEPPEYDLSQIKIPVFLMQGAPDIMVTEEDMAEQQRRMPNAWRINYEGIGHTDFIWDRNPFHALDTVDILFRYAEGTFSA